MRHLLQGLAVVAAAAVLSACNIVVTETPMYAQADASGAPQLREGVWAMLEGDCKADVTADPSTWPECAEPVTIQDGKFSGKNKEGEEETLPYILAAGDPRVMQIELIEPDSKVTLYFYTGVEPLKVDDKGRITAFKAWMVQCGPPPAKDAKRANGQPRFVSETPTEGMQVDPEETMCMPVDKAALARAAAASKGYEDDKGSRAIWAREAP